MKRFYCTICKKVKRVQKWPVMLENQVSGVVVSRVGQCNRHIMGRAQSAQTNQSMKAGR